MRLNTVWRWWDHLRVGLCKKFAAEGVKVRQLPYENLSEREQEIVYNYWQNRQLLREVRVETQKEVIGHV
jgi:hypothetical protein